MNAFLFFDNLPSTVNMEPYSMETMAVKDYPSTILNYNIKSNEDIKTLYHSKSFMEKEHILFEAKSLLPEEKLNLKNIMPENIIFHMHRSIEILHVISGSVMYLVDNKVFNLNSGDFMIFNGFTPHAWMSTSEQRAVISVLYFFPDILQFTYSEDFPSKSSFELLHSLNNFLYLKKDDPTSKLILNFYNEFKKEYEQKMPGYQLMLRAHLVEIFIPILRSQTGGLSQLKNSYNQLSPALYYIDTHFCEKITLEDMSKLTYMNPSYFSTYFKKCIGVSFVKYITALRLSKAHEMLSHTNYTISKIALECGFSTISNFNRLFYQTYNKNPSDLRIS